MPPMLAALFGAAVTLFVALALSLVLRARSIHREALEREKSPVATEVVENIVLGLPISAVIIGPHDEVVLANEQAVEAGLVDGKRLGFKQLLYQVRKVRERDELFRGEICREAKPGDQQLSYHCQIARIDHNQWLLLGYDDAETRRLETLRRDFVANVSHELKTPIGAIGVLSEAVEAAADDPEAVGRFAYRLQKETARLAELVNQIIALSQLQSADPMMKHDFVDLREVVAEAISRCKESAGQRRINLLTGTLAEDNIIGDYWQLVDAAANLIQNAINYSNEGSRVAISILKTSCEGRDFVDLKVSDNGIGIKKEDQEHIFERFYRVDYGRSRSTGGTGLGLSIVRHIALAHQGSVTVWSNPGQGSTFTLRLPIPSKSEASKLEQ